MFEEAFRTGKMLLGSAPEETATLPDMMPVGAMVLAVVFIFLSITLLRRFLEILPLLVDSLFRARSGHSLENSVRYTQDRSMISLLMLIPTLLVVFRYRLYNPSFLHIMDPDIRLAGVAGVLVAFALIRYLIYILLKPRRRADNYILARRVSKTYYILLVLLVLITVGLLSLIKATDLTISFFIYVETAIVYLFLLFRKVQILSGSCNPLRTFSYLCALELIPTAILVVSALVL